jgi:hypothetical protein
MYVQVQGICAEGHRLDRHAHFTTCRETLVCFVATLLLVVSTVGATAISRTSEFPAAIVDSYYTPYKGTQNIM